MTTERPAVTETRDLPDRIVVGANGAYWRDYGDHYSMCVISEDNDPVEIVAIYNRNEADATAWDRGFLAGFKARPAVTADPREAQYAVIDAVLAYAVNILDGVDPGPWQRTRRVLGEVRSELQHPETRARIYDRLSDLGYSVPKGGVERRENEAHAFGYREGYRTARPSLARYFEPFTCPKCQLWIGGHAPDCVTLKGTSDD